MLPIFKNVWCARCISCWVLTLPPRYRILDLESVSVFPYFIFIFNSLLLLLLLSVFVIINYLLLLIVRSSSSSFSFSFSFSVTSPGPLWDLSRASPGSHEIHLHHLACIGHILMPSTTHCGSCYHLMFPVGFAQAMNHEPFWRLRKGSSRFRWTKE